MPAAIVGKFYLFDVYYPLGQQYKKAGNDKAVLKADKKVSTTPKENVMINSTTQMPDITTHKRISIQKAPLFLSTDLICISTDLRRCVTTQVGVNLNLAHVYLLSPKS